MSEKSWENTEEKNITKVKIVSEILRIFNLPFFLIKTYFKEISHLFNISVFSFIYQLEISKIIFDNRVQASISYPTALFWFSIMEKPLKAIQESKSFTGINSHHNSRRRKQRSRDNRPAICFSVANLSGLFCQITRQYKSE